MPLNFRALTRLIIPVLLLVLSGYLLSQVAVLDDSNIRLLGYLPYLLCGVGFVLAFFFNRSRLLASTVLIAACFWGIQRFLQASLDQQQTHYIYTMMSILLPVNVALLALLPERGLRNHFGFLYLLVTPLLVAGMYWQFQSDSSVFVDLPRLWHIKWTEGYILSVGSTLLFALSLIICVFMLCWRNNESEAILALCLVSSYIALGWLHLTMISTIMFAVAAVGIIAGLFRSSHEMAYRDELTGLPGRRALNERLRGLGKHYCIAMLDIDHFKKLNDNHGHDIGDEVLKLVSTRMAGIGGGATTYRYGGEEFCAVFSGRDIEDCVPHLEELREEVANYRMAIRDKGARPLSSKEGSGKRGQATRGVALRVTVSIGVAERTDNQQNPEDVLKIADKALYQSKQRGRNRLSY